MSSEWRELHGIRWKDDLAWMEEMKGPRWERFIKEKQTLWKTLQKGKEDDVSLIEAELAAAKRVGNAPLFNAGPEVYVAHGGTFSYTWHWEGTTETFDASDLDFCKDFPGTLWISEASSTGDESYTLKCLKKGKKEAEWSVKGVGPFVTVVGKRCYSLEAKNSLVYYRLVSWDAVTGKDKKIHYEEHDSRYNLELCRGSCDLAVLCRQSGPKKDCFIIRPSGIVLLDGISLLSRRYIFDKSSPTLYYKYEGGQWKMSKELYRKSYMLPGKGIPETLFLSAGLMVTRWRGIRILWHVSQTRRPQILWRGAGNVLVDPWSGPWVRITQPGREVVWWNSKGNERPHHAPCFRYDVQSKQAGEVPWILVKPCTGSVKGLLVVGYGAYGIVTPLSTARWEPLLTRGWAIALAMFRGGGDHTPEWEDTGRCHGREKVIEEAEGVVRAAREATGMSAAQTVLYGRSAGGLWVGGLVAKHSGGSLFGGAYMEVPYLDVLRTTTNRSLPLTDLEADEFGLPELRLSDFSSILRWSPMEVLEAGRQKPRIWQIVRTGLNDREVFAYESAKWVTRCGPAAVLAVEDGQGHFVSGSRGLRQQAEDLVLLLAFTNGSEKNLMLKYKNGQHA